MCTLSLAPDGFLTLLGCVCLSPCPQFGPTWVFQFDGVCFPVLSRCCGAVGAATSTPSMALRATAAWRPPPAWPVPTSVSSAGGKAPRALGWGLCGTQAAVPEPAVLCSGECGLGVLCERPEVLSNGSAFGNWSIFHI